MPQRYVYTALIMLGIFILTYIGFSSLNYVLLLSMMAVPIAIFLVNHPLVWLLIGIGLANSLLRVPGAPETISLYDLASAGLVALLLAARIIDKETRVPPAANRLFAYAFAAVIIVHICLRGIGFQALGSPLQGGGPYVILIVGILLFLLIDMIVVPTKIWVAGILLYCALSFVPIVVQLLLEVSAGKLAWLYNFVQPKGFLADTLAAGIEGFGLQRWNTGFLIVLMYIPLFAFRKPFRVGWPLLISGATICITVLLISMSGSRYAILLAFFFLGCWAVIERSGLNLLRPILLVTAGAIFLSVLAVYSEYLPEPLQRAISFIPFASTGDFAAMDAESTWQWRLYVWERAIGMIPDNLIIGQGMAFDGSPLIALKDDPAEYAHEWAFVCRAYHHGFLSLLLILGIPGLITGLGFLYLTALKHYRLLQGPNHDDLLSRLYRVIIALFVSRAVMFVTLGGDVQNFYPSFLFLAMLLEGIACTRRHQNIAALEAENEEENIPRPGLAEKPKLASTFY